MFATIRAGVLLAGELLTAFGWDAANWVAFPAVARPRGVGVGRRFPVPGSGFPAR